jgi:hypothetical protein
MSAHRELEGLFFPEGGDDQSILGQSSFYVPFVVLAILENQIGEEMKRTVKQKTLESLHLCLP